MAMQACSECGKPVSTKARACPHCGAPVESGESTAPTSPAATRPAAAPPAASQHAAAAQSLDLSFVLLGIPLASTLLIWFWVGDLNLFQDPGSKMNLILLFTVLGTASVAAFEAQRVGMVSNRKEGSYSPTAWFFLIALLWVIGYPAYLLKRRKYGLANRIVPGILVAVVFFGSWAVMMGAIEDQKAEVRDAFSQAEQELESLGQAFQVAPAGRYTIVDSSGNTFTFPERDVPQVTLTGERDVIRLDSSCKAFSQLHGEGTWSWSNAGWSIEFQGAFHGFVRGESPVSTNYSECRS